MTKVYACLIGNWVCLNDDPNCLIGGIHSPEHWWKNSDEVYAPIKREEKNRFTELDYVHIEYQGVDYRINPIFIQIITTS